MHPFLVRRPRLLSFANFISKWLLLAEGLVGLVDVINNWKEIVTSPYGILIAFNHKGDLITNHIASIAAISIVALFFFFEGGFLKYDGAFNKICWIALIIGIHENLWWATHLFFLRGQDFGAYLFFGSLNYPMFMLVFYIVAFGWGKRETILLGAMMAFYFVWALNGFHVTSDVTGNTQWLNDLVTNVTESLSWVYVCIVGAACYLLKRRRSNGIPKLS